MSIQLKQATKNSLYRILFVGNTGKLLLRVAAALAWRGALSSSPFLKQEEKKNNNIILATTCSYVILPCETNTD